MLIYCYVYIHMKHAHDILASLHFIIYPYLPWCKTVDKKENTLFSNFYLS